MGGGADTAGRGGEVEADAALDGYVGFVDFNARGVDVRGGGSGAPLRSPLTLRFSGGSSGTTVLPFFPPTLSLPPTLPTRVLCLRASSSSKLCS